MATLTETAYYSRLTIKWGGIGLVVFLIFRSLALAGIAYYKKLNPPPPPPPTVLFGKLPKIQFPEQKIVITYTYSLETVNQGLPKMPDRATVYFMPKPTANFNTKEAASTWARKLNFVQEPEETALFNYKFTSVDSPPSYLEINALTRNFHYWYDWKNDLEVTRGLFAPTEDEAIQRAKKYLSTLGRLEEDLKTGTAQIQYYKYDEGNLKSIPYSSGANFVGVNLFRADVENLKVLPPDPVTGNVNLLLSSIPNSPKTVIEARFNYYPYSAEKSSTYPIKTADQAWKEFTEGQGYVAHLNENGENNVIIRKVYLAYYDSDEPQSFLQPVFVFEGDNNFFGYLPAVSANWAE